MATEEQEPDALDIFGEAYDETKEMLEERISIWEGLSTDRDLPLVKSVVAGAILGSIQTIYNRVFADRSFVLASRKSRKENG